MKRLLTRKIVWYITATYLLFSVVLVFGSENLSLRIYVLFTLIVIGLNELMIRQPFKYRRWRQLRRNGGSHTELEWSMLKWRQHNRCAKCLRQAKLTKDHIIPVSMGGLDSIDNIQGLCTPCNSSKGCKIIDYR